ncbi:zinc-ribbon domain containing protein [Limnofasciculus baicalensis]|uniref:Zinc-ribbon domain-containing protein n=1 Tax=Limnofasciculus baicalensis BBK-W-15 TaxID=2699891 RepID=A0AAE3GWD2_9CYAN|nr:zinc-ribbon domain containing protein [Limnofasciculus baicalensis]MCP2731277.1 zinc-ribbon domain-containing protein [Limnofasciculus baicalensis BBK-W-15]
MKSGKQRRIELKAQKQARKIKLANQKLAAREAMREAENLASGGVIVDLSALAPNNSYGEPDFVKRKYYFDQPFICAGCNSQEVWTAVQQKWWYEVAKGGLFSTAKFCRTCRRQEQSRRAEARRIHLEGIAKKRQGNRLFINPSSTL